MAKLKKIKKILKPFIMAECQGWVLILYGCFNKNLKYGNWVKAGPKYRRKKMKWIAKIKEDDLGHCQNQC